MRRNNKSIYIVFIIVVLIGITIGYAVINTTLNINGKSSISKNTWDVYFDNIVVKEDSVEAEKIPTITDKTTVDFEVALNLPGDFYEFTVDVVNAGSIDAMINNIEKTPVLTEEQAKYLNYTITYENNENITTKQLVKKEEYVRLKVRVEYKKDISASDLPTNTETLNLIFTVNYIQSDGTGSDVKDNGVLKPVANGSIEDIGTVVTIGSEQFYTIGTEGDNVKLLAMYNLNVGNKVIAFNMDTGEYTAVPLTSPTGLQSSEALSGVVDENLEPLHLPWIGTVAFDTEEKHVPNYSGSLIETYVNDYEVAIEAMGVNVESARLITKDELVNTFGCNESENTCTGSAYPWIYATTYWSGSAGGTNAVWSVDSDGYFSPINIVCGEWSGVRPVIVISKSYF